MENTKSIGKHDERTNLRNMIFLAVFTAIAYISVFIFRIPILFLSYELKDAVVAIAGFVLGPLATVIMSVVLSLIEMVTISETGPIGALMNFISTIGFALPAAIIFKKFKSLNGVVAGLSVGTVIMTILMLLWNYIITPFYMGVPREAVVGMLLPLLLPFNLFKAITNSAIVILIFEPLSNALKALHIIPKESVMKADKKVIKILVYCVCVAVIIFALVVAFCEPLKNILFKMS